MVIKPGRVWVRLVQVAKIEHYFNICSIIKI